MRFRITLFNDTDSIEINEPDGLRDAVLKLDRDENFHSLIQFFEGAFIFYGENDTINGGFHFIKQTEITFGPDANLRALVEIAPDDETYDTLHDGQFKLSDLEEMPDNKIKVPIIRDDFWAKFIARLDTPVNIQSATNLDDESCNVFDAISLQLSPQKLRQIYSAKYDQGVFVNDGAGNDYLDTYIQLDPYYIILDEIEDVFSIGNYTNTELPVWILEAKYGGSYLFNLRLEASESNNITPSDFLNPKAKTYLQINDETPIEFTETNFGGGGTNESTVYTYSATHDLNAGDVVRIYILVTVAITGANRVYIWGEANDAIAIHHTPEPPSEVDNPSFFYIEAQTVFPETNAPGFLVHDAGGQIVDRITGTDNSFYSEFLGSSQTLYKQYEQDGCMWTNAIARGLQIRQYSLAEKPFFISFKKWWDGVNPILNLGLGYEDILGEQVIRVEQKDHFYNQAQGTSYDFSNVRSIVRKYDNDRIYNKVELGYSKWESEDISGIDDPQSKRIYASRFKKIGQTITLLSEFIGASLAWETTRRTTREKSADYKYDNEIFIVSINPTEIEESPPSSPDVITFGPELDENFSSVTNLLNSETRYNIRHSVGRMFLRWQSYLQGCLQSYLGSLFKFTSGEGNFDMASTMDFDCDAAYNAGAELIEDQDFTVDSEIFHLCNLYEITAPLEYEDFELIAQSRKLPVGVSQGNTGHTQMFIKTMSYKVAKSEVTFEAWPVEFFDIQVQESFAATQECFPVAGACEDAITDENGIDITDENGICITA